MVPLASPLQSASVVDVVNSGVLFTNTSIEDEFVPQLFVATTLTDPEFIPKLTVIELVPAPEAIDASAGTDQA